MPDDPVAPLLLALEHSPENVPLRAHVGQSLMDAGRFDEAEAVYRVGLALKPNCELSLGLAKCFQRQGRRAECSVLLEEVISDESAPTEAFLIQTKMLLQDGEIREAVAAYRELLKRDPRAEDPMISERLGVSAADVQGGDEEWQERDAHDVVDGRVRAHAEGLETSGPVPLEKPAVNFSDVGGMESLKEDIRMKIIFPMTHPEIYQAYGKSAGGGILLYGPPGVGKTHLARATAGEVNAGFISIGISDVLDMWIGQSERNLHEIFEYARANKPCVLFFDEVDALGASRSDMRGSAGRQVINQFLAELDGIDSQNDGILILAATNAPWHLDSAFRRPGRFDRIIFVPPPDEPARADILRVLVRGKPVDEIDMGKLARKTDRFSGADLKALLESAIEDKLREAMRTGKPEPLSTRDLLRGIGKIKPTTREWFSTARNHAMYANQGGIYDDILEYLGIRK